MTLPHYPRDKHRLHPVFTRCKIVYVDHILFFIATKISVPVRLNTDKVYGILYTYDITPSVA